MWLTLAGAILFELCGTLALRASDGFRKKFWIASSIPLWKPPVSLAFCTLA